MVTNFTGTMQISPINKPSFMLDADWTYNPEYKCWYGDGRSFPEEICSIIEGQCNGIPMHKNQ